MNFASSQYLAICILSTAVVLWNAFRIYFNSTNWQYIKAELVNYDHKIGDSQIQQHVTETAYMEKYPEIGTKRIIYYEKGNSNNTLDAHPGRNELNYIGLVVFGIVLCIAIYCYYSSN